MLTKRHDDDCPCFCVTANISANPQIDPTETYCCERPDAEALTGRASLSRLALSCPRRCVAVCRTSKYCCGDPTTTTTTTITTTTPEVCTDCTCFPVYTGSYGSRKWSKTGRYCCSRAQSLALKVLFLPNAYYASFCPTRCVAKCGFTTHCCEGSPRTTKKRPRICFPSTASLNLQNGKSVTMSKLQIGDKVQTGKNIGFIMFWLYVLF